MMDIESAFWRLVSYNFGGVQIVQKASGAIRTVTRGRLPSVNELAMMHESRFNAVCREAFANAGTC